MKHWQDAVNAVLGAWLVASPWVFGFQDNQNAVYAMVALGAALVALSVGALIVPRLWEEWLAGLLGLCAIVAPWMLDLRLDAATSAAYLVTGLLVIGLVWWSLTTEPEYRSRSMSKPPLP